MGVGPSSDERNRRRDFTRKRKLKADNEWFLKETHKFRVYRKFGPDPSPRYVRMKKEKTDQAFRRRGTYWQQKDTERKKELTKLIEEEDWQVKHNIILGAEPDRVSIQERIKYLAGKLKNNLFTKIKPGVGGKSLEERVNYLRRILGGLESTPSTTSYSYQHGRPPPFPRQKPPTPPPQKPPPPQTRPPQTRPQTCIGCQRQRW